MTRKRTCSPPIGRHTPFRKPSTARVETLEPRRLLTSNLLTLGSTLFDAAFAVAALPDGGRIVAGTFGGTVNFSTGSSASQSTRTAAGDSDIFLLRQAENGTILWVQSFGGTIGDVDDEPLFSSIHATNGDFVNGIGPTVTFQGEYVTSLKVDGSRIYLGGSFQGTVDFDPTDGVVNRVSTTRNHHDAFVAAFNLSDGTLAWVSTFGGRFDDAVRDLAVTPDGGVVATGYFTRDADFNPTQTGVRLVQALGRDDLFVVKLRQTDSAPIGRLQWVYTAGGEAIRLQDRDSGEGIAVDARGNVYVTGTYAADADFDPSRSRLIIPSIESRVDGFLLRLSPRGKLDYVKTFGGEGVDGGKAIGIDGAGRMYLAGYFSETADLDPGPGVRQLTARQDGDAFDSDNASDNQGRRRTDLFLAQVGLKGTLQWVQPVGGDDYEYLSRMDVAANGEILLSGAFAGRIYFEPPRSAADTTNSLLSVLGNDDFDDDTRRDSSYDAFIARYNSEGAFLEARQYGGAGDDWATAAVFRPGRSGAEVAGLFRQTASFSGTGEGGPTGVARGLDDLFALSSN
ncbi:MAG: SBBP repeat-containing protein [Phycisphaerae bacterium]|nr:SBBP repeat-containing protein [Phycisphaerae bacterium]MDW8261764.1 SBBP repeat-containing protein [Phycisphaerales bacterium]